MPGYLKNGLIYINQPKRGQPFIMHDAFKRELKLFLIIIKQKSTDQTSEKTIAVGNKPKKAEISRSKPPKK